MLATLLNEMLKHTDEQPDEERHKVRYGRVLSTGTLSRGVAVHHPPVGVRLPLGSSLNHRLLGSSLCGHDQLLTPISSPPPLSGGSGVGGKIPSF